MHLGDERQERAGGAQRDQDDRGGQVVAAAERGDGDDHGRQGRQGEREMHSPIEPDGCYPAVSSATQRIGSPQPSSEMPCRPSAITTRQRRCAAKVSTCAIIPP